jgi:lipoprotein-anchoring transpeptidase ErfK/SrfK
VASLGLPPHSRRDGLEIDLGMTRTVMLLRCLSRLGAAAAVFALSATMAHAQLFNDPEERITGGAPLGPLFRGWFSRSSSPIPRTLVSYPTREAPGTIIINTRERRLYLITAPGQALRYGIGVGRIGFTWSGVTRVTAKREWPSWTPPPQMLHRQPHLPRFMPGGPNNPLGARALYLGSTLYRIHGSNEPETIGQAVSSGCFRLTNEDVIDLYNRVSIGAKVIVLN